MLALCLLLSFGTIGITMLLFFESKDKKRLNNLLNDYRDRRHSDELTLNQMEELMTSHRHHYRETIGDYKSLIMDMTSKISNPVEKLKAQGEAAIKSVSYSKFEKAVDSKLKGLKVLMHEGPEEDITLA